MKTLHSIIAFACLSLLTTGSALAQQDIIEIPKAVGTCIIANITPEQAMETALFNAKVDALRKAKILETVDVTNKDIDGIFVQLITNEIKGGVVGYEVVNEDIKIVGEGKSKILTYEVTINANVTKYSQERDPSFQFKTEGIKPSYKDEERVSFWVTPYQNGYLRIFLFEEDGTGQQVYPNDKFLPDRLLLQDETVRFPQNKRTLTITKTDKTKSKEKNRILFLFLKDNVKFIGSNITLQSVSNWIAGISPDRRTEEFYSFTIE